MTTVPKRKRRKMGMMARDSLLKETLGFIVHLDLETCEACCRSKLKFRL